MVSMTLSLRKDINMKCLIFLSMINIVFSKTYSLQNICSNSVIGWVGNSSAANDQSYRKCLQQVQFARGRLRLINDTFLIGHDRSMKLRKRNDH